MDEDAEALRAIDDEIRQLEEEEARNATQMQQDAYEDDEETDEFYEYERSTMTGAYYKSQHPEQYQRMVLEHQTLLAQQQALEEARRRASYIPTFAPPQLQPSYMPPMMYVYNPTSDPNGYYQQQQQVLPILQFPPQQLLGLTSPPPPYMASSSPPPLQQEQPQQASSSLVNRRSSTTQRRASIDGAAPATRPRGASQTVLDELQLKAQNEVFSASTQKSDLFTVIRATTIFVLAMFGESLFVMVRDWLDGSSSGRHQKSMQGSSTSTGNTLMEEEAFVAAAVEVLETEQRKKGQPEPTQKQKIFRAKSIRKLAQAKSVREMIKGLVNTGRNAEATALASSVLAMRRRMYGDAHPATANAWNQLASSLTQDGDYAQAEQAYKDALKVVRRAFKENNAREAKVLHNLGILQLLMAEEAKKADQDNEEEVKRLRLEAKGNGLEALRIVEIVHEEKNASKKSIILSPSSSSSKKSQKRFERTRAHIKHVWTLDDSKDKEI